MNPRAFKDRRRAISAVKMAGTNPNGRYRVLTTGNRIGSFRYEWSVK